MNEPRRPSSLPRNSRPSRPRLEPLEPRELLAVDFDFAMADRFGLDLNRNGIIDLPNTATYAQASTFSVALAVVDDAAPGPGVIYDFTLRRIGAGATAPFRLTRSASAFVGDGRTLQLPQGDYRVAFQRFDGDTRTDLVNRVISIRDVLIVAMGDSYASGEGNPERAQTGLSFFVGSTNRLYDTNLNTSVSAAGFTSDVAEIALASTITPSIWADAALDVPAYGPGPYDGVAGFENMQLEHEDAHRTTLSATAQYALRLEQSDPRTSVTYVSVAQSGATVASALTRGVLKGRVRTNYGMPSQVDELSRILGSRPVDQLFVSLGGNDVGFSTLAAEFLGASIFASDPLGSVTQTTQIAAAQTAAINVGRTSSIIQNLILPDFNRAARSLVSSYRTLNRALVSSLAISPSNVFITEYPDTSRVTSVMNGGAAQVPWWGTSLTDVLPGLGLSASVSFITSQFLNATNIGQVVANTLVPLTLNGAVQRGAAINGWNYVGGTTAPFLSQGYAASSNLADESALWATAGNVAPPDLGSNRMVRTARESVILIGPISANVLDPITTRTSGTLHPNVRGHQAISEVIEAAVTPQVRIATRLASRAALLGAIVDRPREARNRGLIFTWDFERTPGEGAFLPEAAGPRVRVDRLRLASTGTLRVINRFGVSREIPVARVAAALARRV
ncbi:MAG: hypothetical protein SFX72_21905 [Isosphaeraceae bacterium]|nr:hypothetical protein [Isosphaeraceae bacterium]